MEFWSNLMYFFFQYVVEKTPCWVERSISRCTPHLKDLAQPNLQRSIEEKHLSSNIQKEMNKPCLSPKEALRALKLRIKCRRLRINSQQRRIEKLCQRWRESNCELLRKFSTTRLWSRVIMEDNLVSHSSADKADFKYSKVILNEICELMSQKSPTRKPTDCVDEAILQIADKVNLWMIGVLDKSDFWKLETTTDESGCSEELIESCLHNEQNMHVEEDPLTISHGKSLRSPKDTEKVLSPKSSQRKLSFLRKSQIIIDPQTCREIFDRIGQIKKLKVEKEQRKLSRQMKTTNVKNQHLVFSSQQNGKPKNVNQKVDPKSKKGGNRPETDKNILECTPNEGLIWDVQWVKK